MALKEIRELCGDSTLYSVIMRKLLDFMREERPLETVKAEADTYIEMENSMHNLDTLLDWLEDAGAVARRKEKDGKDQREYLKTTDDGMSYLSESSPKSRMDLFLEKEAEHRDVIIDLIGFCSQPRGIPALETKYSANERIAAGKITPNYIVMELEQAGVLEWRNGWVTTLFGKGYL